ncbi:OadG family protein [bacterium]|nr:OadG family protein [bacterium]
MNETILEGLSLMGLGMGFVLSFLCVMILAMTIMSKIVRYLNTIFPETVEVTDKKSVSKSIGDDAAIALAIVAAKYRR